MGQGDISVGCLIPSGTQNDSALLVVKEKKDHAFSLSLILQYFNLFTKQQVKDSFYKELKCLQITVSSKDVSWKYIGENYYFSSVG